MFCLFSRLPRPKPNTSSQMLVLPASGSLPCFLQHRSLLLRSVAKHLTKLPCPSQMHEYPLKKQDVSTCTFWGEDLYSSSCSKNTRKQQVNTANSRRKEVQYFCHQQYMSVCSSAKRMCFDRLSRDLQLSATVHSLSVAHAKDSDMFRKYTFQENSSVSQVDGHPSACSKGFQPQHSSNPQ